MNYFERTLKHFALFDLSTRMGLGLRLPTKANAQMWLDRIENELSPRAKAIALAEPSSTMTYSFSLSPKTL